MKEGDKLDRRGKIVKSGRVRFAEVELKQNLRLCKSLGIKKLPYIHYYKAGIGKIDDYVCLPKVRMLSSYLRARLFFNYSENSNLLCNHLYTYV